MQHHSISKRTEHAAFRYVRNSCPLCYPSVCLSSRPALPQLTVGELCLAVVSPAPVCACATSLIILCLHLCALHPLSSLLKTSVIILDSSSSTLNHYATVIKISFSAEKLFSAAIYKNPCLSSINKKLSTNSVEKPLSQLN